MLPQLEFVFTIAVFDGLETVRRKAWHWCRGPQCDSLTYMNAILLFEHARFVSETSLPMTF